MCAGGEGCLGSFLFCLPCPHSLSCFLLFWRHPPSSAITQFTSGFKAGKLSLAQVLRLVPLLWTAQRTRVPLPCSGRAVGSFQPTCLASVWSPPVPHQVPPPGSPGPAPEAAACAEVTELALHGASSGACFAELLCSPQAERWGVVTGSQSTSRDRWKETACWAWHESIRKGPGGGPSLSPRPLALQGFSAWSRPTAWLLLSSSALSGPALDSLKSEPRVQFQGSWETECCKFPFYSSPVSVLITCMSSANSPRILKWFFFDLQAKDPHALCVTPPPLHSPKCEHPPTQRSLTFLLLLCVSSY